MSKQTTTIEKRPDSINTLSTPQIAYFSMEVAIDHSMPTYSGGLGVLAADTVRSAADMNIPMIAVTLLHRKGYFFQTIADNGIQQEEAVQWKVDDHLIELPHRVNVEIENQTVLTRGWLYNVQGINKHNVPIIFLDTDLPENSEWTRSITDHLYGNNKYYKLCQEIVLGIAGVRMLRALNFFNIQRFHMNEGHAAFLTIELLIELIKKEKITEISNEDITKIKEQCIFTTHTPVPAGHDVFTLSEVQKAFLMDNQSIIYKELIQTNDNLNMTELALRFSHYVNGVASKHGEVTKELFPNYAIDSITNGVHAATWVSKPFATLFNEYINKWEEDNFNFRYAINIPKEKIWATHLESKASLIEHVNSFCNAGMDMKTLTIGFARRATGYKRADLIFKDIERLKNIVKNAGNIQIIFSGKAHPQDHEGKELIQKIFQAKHELDGIIKIAYIDNYDLNMAKIIIPGVDIWLNTPAIPMEASGTSGMKAALNGVPSLSVLDGWWLEGHIENITGWSIGDSNTSSNSDSYHDASSLYDKLEHTVLPMYYNHNDMFVSIMRNAIALNGSFFNTQRMLLQYISKAYFL